MFTKTTETKRLLAIVVTVVFLVLGTISVAIFDSFSEYQTALKKRDVTAEIETEVYERRLNASEYLLNFLDRAKDQWYARQAHLERLAIQQLTTYRTQTEKSYIEAVQKTLQEARTTFDNAVATLNETADGSSEQVIAGKKERVAGELAITAQRSIDAVRQLRELDTRAADTSLTTIITLFSAAGVVLAVVLTISFWLIWRSALQLGRRKAEDEAILRSIGDGVFAIDLEGRIILYNRAAQALSGFSLDEALYEPYDAIFQFRNEKTGAVVDDFIRQALAGQQASMGSHTILTRVDGTTLPIADSAAPIRNNGAVTGAVVVFRDVSKERQIERMKDEFLSTASHELRTPMGAIRANISMVLAGDYGPVNKDLIEPLQDMRNSTVRLVDLVNDLLNVARIEAGRLKYTLQDCDSARLIRQVVANLAPLGKEKGVEIVTGHNESIQVHVDADKVIQALTNLVGNSLKFTDKGWIAVSSSVSDDLVTIEVTDTGIGISPEDQKKLFSKFQQIGSAQQGKPQGTGLGLYISRQIIRKMGGELWIQSSQPGHGTVFAFTLPRSHSPQAIKAAQAIEQEAQEHPDQK